MARSTVAKRPRRPARTQIVRRKSDNDVLTLRKHVKYAQVFFKFVREHFKMYGKRPIAQLSVPGSMI